MAKAKKNLFGISILAILITLVSYIFYSSITGFKTFTLGNNKLNDPETQVVFSDANKVYEVNLDGGRPDEIASFPRNVNSIGVLKNGDILVDIDYGYYVKYNNDPDNKQTRHKSTPEEEKNHYFLIKNNSDPVKITPNQYRLFEQANNNASNERITTKVLPSGTAEIISQKPGSSPEAIGEMNRKLIYDGNEWGPPIYTYPSGFYPSFDGKLLLNSPPGGGGLGQSSIVLSRDGQRSYDIDFYWFVSTAIWIDNNKILSIDQRHPLGISTIEESGEVTRIPLKDIDLGFFQQNQLSPDRKNIVYHEPRGTFEPPTDKTLSVFNIEEQNLVNISMVGENLNYKPRPGETIYTGSAFLGWNIKSNMILYSESTRVRSDDPETHGKVLSSKILVYDLTNQRSIRIADLDVNLYEYRHPELMIKGKPTVDISHFGIR